MHKLVRWDPFRDLDDLHKAFFGGLRTMSVPVSDVYVEDGKNLVVKAQLPDFDEDEVNIHVNDGVLEIRAEHREQEDDKQNGRKYVVRESSSSFYRSMALPINAQEDKIDAHFDKGVLNITIPLTPKPEPKKVAIKGSLTKNKK